MSDDLGTDGTLARRRLEGEEEDVEGHVAAARRAFEPDDVSATRRAIDDDDVEGHDLRK
ncbi:MAG: hypothetical protein H0W07_09935 [Chloroflexi bacterium]|nr:hypothetical protein [Chloroflexota bacterium]